MKIVQKYKTVLNGESTLDQTIQVLNSFQLKFKKELELSMLQDVLISGKRLQTFMRQYETKPFKTVLQFANVLEKLLSIIGNHNIFLFSKFQKLIKHFLCCIGQFLQYAAPDYPDYHFELIKLSNQLIQNCKENVLATSLSECKDIIPAFWSTIKVASDYRTQYEVLSLHATLLKYLDSAARTAEIERILRETRGILFDFHHVVRYAHYVEGTFYNVARIFLYNYNSKILSTQNVYSFRALYVLFGTMKVHKVKCYKDLWIDINVFPKTLTFDGSFPIPSGRLQKASVVFKIKQLYLDGDILNVYYLPPPIFSIRLKCQKRLEALNIIKCKLPPEEQARLRRNNFIDSYNYTLKRDFQKNENIMGCNDEPSPRISPIISLQDSSKSSSQASTQRSPQSSTQVSTQASPKTLPQILTQVSTQITPQDSSKKRKKLSPRPRFQSRQDLLTACFGTDSETSHTGNRSVKKQTRKRKSPVDNSEMQMGKKMATELARPVDDNLSTNPNESLFSGAPSSIHGDEVQIMRNNWSANNNNMIDFNIGNAAHSTLNETQIKEDQVETDSIGRASELSDYIQTDSRGNRMVLLRRTTIIDRNSNDSMEMSMVAEMVNTIENEAPRGQHAGLEIINEVFEQNRNAMGDNVSQALQNEISTVDETVINNVKVISKNILLAYNQYKKEKKEHLAKITQLVNLLNEETKTFEEKRRAIKGCIENLAKLIEAMNTEEFKKAIEEQFQKDVRLLEKTNEQMRLSEWQNYIDKLYEIFFPFYKMKI